jgi:hypothetical protein
MKFIRQALCHTEVMRNDMHYAPRSLTVAEGFFAEAIFL